MGVVGATPVVWARTGEGPKPTLPSGSFRGRGVAEMGHEDQFRPPSLSGGCRLGKATFAGTGGKEEDAPIAEIAKAADLIGQTTDIVGGVVISASGVD